jgi:hypothetical protein
MEPRVERCFREVAQQHVNTSTQETHTHRDSRKHANDSLLWKT